MSTTLTIARRALGFEVGGYTYVTASGGSTTTAIASPVFRSSELPTTAFAYTWLFNPAGTEPRQRRVTKTGLDPTTNYQVTLEAPLGSAVGNGTVVELSSLVPPIGLGTTIATGLHEALNAAARHILVPYNSSVTLVDGQYAYTLPSWLDRPSRLRSVLYAGPNTGKLYDSWRPYRIFQSGDSLTLHFDAPFRIRSGSFSFIVEGVRPAFSLINSADSTVGLSVESDTIDVELNDLVTVALLFVYRGLRDARHGDQRDHYAKLAETQLALARGVDGFVLDEHSTGAAPATPSGVA